MSSIYDLDDCLRRISEGQRHARRMFDFILKLEWEAEDADGNRIVREPSVDKILLFAERLIYESE